MSHARANLDGTGVDLNFITGANGPVGVAVNGSYIFWRNLNTNMIGRANLDGTGVNQNLTTANAPGNGIAADGNHIFWNNGTFVARANLDATGVNSTFLNLGRFDSAQYIAVDSAHIYVTGTGILGIARANIDGTGLAMDFVQGLTGSENGVAVDGNYIYWMGLLNGIYRSNLDGTGAETLIAPPAVGQFIAVLPEPGTGLLVMAGVLGLAIMRRKEA
jgi:hypothetical protein